MNSVSPPLRPNVPLGTEPRDFGPKPRIEFISKHKFIIDERYQRAIKTRKSESLIKNIEQKFTWVKFQILTAVDNGDDTYCLVDGQHRHAGVMLIDEIDEVPSFIADAETLKDQAQLFVDLNTNRVQITPIAMHRARVRAGDPTATLVDRVITAGGCTVPRSQAPQERMKAGEILCIGTIKKCISINGESTTINVLRMLKEVWPYDGGIRGEIISAVCTAAQLKLVSYESLRNILQLRSPDDLLAQAYIKRANSESKEPLTKHIVKLLVSYAGQSDLRLRAS